MDYGIWPDDIERRLTPYQWEMVRAELADRAREERVAAARERASAR